MNENSNNGKIFPDNFDEENIKTLADIDIPDKSYRLIEGSFGTSNIKPAVSAMKKSAELLFK